ncbi:senecionine N-oxygenase-like isoform X2 [Sipha flava]|uniref:Flavin-containing monooxygenase n=1 Tax=Sipha flava TaxID=143950 RepID=A0A8B8FDH5_9HEMI|nr:senecionine N-oxygenase-like isoform X2 [Sipha flava]
MKIAIIGAGVAGLASARRCLENGFECVVFERTKRVGGTWVYDERIGLDEFGLPIHTSMYKCLMTNLPKELMNYPNFPYKGLDNVSFLTPFQVQEYIEQFTKHFKLIQHIRFCSLVTSVERLTNIWQVIVEDLMTKTARIEYFDAVMVCNGHNAVPRIPDDKPGMNEFVGVDISVDVAKVANQVYFSHNNPKLLDKEFPDNIAHKPAIEYFTEKTVCFIDKTSVALDAIIYCTGFKIALPFLKPSCGINLINDELITSLHKNIVNMNNPSMGFIGFINMNFVFPIFDLQARYYIEFLRNNYSANENWMTAVNTHVVGHYLLEYCKSLALEEIKIEPIPMIIFRTYWGCQKLREENFGSYRSAVFRIIDSNKYFIEFDKNNAKNKFKHTV